MGVEVGEGVGSCDAVCVSAHFLYELPFARPLGRVFNHLNGREVDNFGVFAASGARAVGTRYARYFAYGVHLWWEVQVCGLPRDVVHGAFCYKVV